MKSYGYIALALSVMAFIYWYSDSQYKAGYSAASFKYEKEKSAISQALETNRIQYEKSVNAITELWLQKEPEQVIKYETINKEIVKYVNNDVSCNYSVGAAWLLHSASQNTDMQESVYSTFVDAEKRQTSTIGKEDILIACTGWAGEYYSAIDQLHALQAAISTDRAR